MSTDLELRQELVEIRLPALNIKINNSHHDQSSSDTTSDDVDGTVIQTQESTTCSNVISIHEEEECRTPKSQQNMIPEILTCPPAPKKPRSTPSSSCKRKLAEFFEFVGRDEVESFFQQFGVRNSTSAGVVKKRCTLV